MCAYEVFACLFCPSITILTHRLELLAPGGEIQQTKKGQEIAQIVFGFPLNQLGFFRSCSCISGEQRAFVIQNKNFPCPACSLAGQGL